jgi:tRNA modification GTPase
MNTVPADVVLLTPPGRGAVASLRVRGPAAIEVIEQCLESAGRPPLGELPAAAIALRRWSAAPASGEEVVVAVLDPQTVEVHGHGGTAVCEALIESLLALGCRRVSWSEWKHEREDTLAAEARAALAEAETERVAGILLDQFRGALRGEIQAIVERIDAQDVRQANERLHQLVGRGAFGLRLTRPWRVVIAGRPNVGKSSLANALLGFDRAIVFDQPGTTRDVLTAATAVDGWPVELHDTAGLRIGGDAIETAGVAKAEAQIQAADLVVFVGDASQPWTDADEALLRAAGDPLVVHNKSDLPSPQRDERRPAGIAVSALSGAGLPALLHAISLRLVPEPPAPGSAVPFTSRQVTLLRSALEALRAGNSALARSRLVELLE